MVLLLQQLRYNHGKNILSSCLKDSDEQCNDKEMLLSMEMKQSWGLLLAADKDECEWSHETNYEKFITDDCQAFVIMIIKIG